MSYSIGETARLLQVPPSTLRYYDREGLLPFVERTGSGTRRFSEKDIRWLKIISCLKSAGMPLKDIRRYIEMAMMGEETVDERLQMFVEQKRRLKEQIEELQSTMEVVNYKCWYYETAKQAGQEAVARDMPDEKIPERFRAVRSRLRDPEKSFKK